MRKFTNRLFAFLFFLIPLVTNAQTTSITGKIVNEKNGIPVEGATIMVKGKTTGTKTDANGNFTIAANKGDVIVVSSVNFKAQQIKVKDNTAINVRLLTADETLEEVLVVTAMDIKRNSRELGYAAQGVSGAKVQETGG